MTRLLLGLTTILLCSCAHTSPVTPLTAHSWPQSTPEAQGISSAALADALDSARIHELAIHSLTIVRNGVLVLDVAFYPYERGTRHDVASVTKSITSLLLGAAHIPLAATLSEFFPQLDDASKRSITVAHLLGMRSGFACGIMRGEAELSRMFESRDWIANVLAMPMRSAPGTEWAYCSPNYHLLSGMLTSRVHESELAYAQHALFAPLGINDAYWPADKQGITHGWGDLQLRPTDLAAIGELLLHDGVADGRQLIPAEWIHATTRATTPANDDFYGLGWWRPKNAPSERFFEANGRGGQRLSIWPERNLVVVMTGGGFEPADVGKHLARALKSDRALPPDSVGARRLQQAIARAAAPPRLRIEPMSSLAWQIDRRPFIVEANSLGLRSFTLHFSGMMPARAVLALADRTLDLTVGLDGRYRFASQTIDGVHPAARGEWLNDYHFSLEVNLVGKINDYTIDFVFNGASTRVLIQEATGLIDERVGARPVGS